MSAVSHNAAPNNTTARADAARAIDSLREQVLARLELIEAGPVCVDFEQLERTLHELVVAAEREVFADALSRLDVDLPYVWIDGRRHHRALRCAKTFTTVAGAVTVERTLYREGKQESMSPLELHAGIIAGHWTPLAARHGCHLVAHLTPADSERVLAELGNMTPSKSSLDRLSKTVSQRWEERRETFEETLREELEVPSEASTVAVSLDGVMAPMKDAKCEKEVEKPRGKAKTAKGPTGYREVGCATLTFFDADGERLETLRYARMPQANKAALKETLHKDLDTVLSQRPELRLVKLADGAQDNWSFLSEALPKGEELIDFFHGAQHLKAAFDNAYSATRAGAEYEKYRHLLRHESDGVDKVIRALKHLHEQHPRRKRIQQVLEYFRKHRHRMGYAKAKADNLPIGSGVVEAACKTLVSQRMKCSGMRWRHPGGQAILTFRAQIQSARFDRAWDLLTDSYDVPISLPDNVVPIRRAHAN